jgi:2,3-bisphosphoglycerate-independent phosphoglycerate mutase
MSATEIVNLIVPEIHLETDAPDFICLNFANPDMVGHTGVFEAIVRAVEHTDDCLRDVVAALTSNGYSAIIIADHGNADLARNPDGTAHTAHTTNPVPMIGLGLPSGATLQDGILADVAPTILDMMGIDRPEAMTGSSLIVRS